jgi:hypothetical protein
MSKDGAAEGLVAEAASAQTVSEDAPTEEGDPANREAAKYRVRLREVEGERDRLTEQLENVRAQLVQDHARKYLVDPSDVWFGGGVEEMLAEDGSVDPERVKDVCARLTEQRPHWRRPRSTPDPDQGKRSDSVGANWSTMFGSAS